MTATVTVASPFFTPYLLRRLDFSYSAYMTLVGASFAAKGVALTFLGGICRRFGVLRVLRASAFGVVLIPFLCFAPSPPLASSSRLRGNGLGRP
jgi:hypothetical protein